MRNLHNVLMENWNVDEVTANIPGANQVLYENGISATHRYSLANAAAATGTSLDELTAAMQYRMRRTAAQPRVEREAVVTEGELVA